MFLTLAAHAQLRVSPLAPATGPLALKHAGRVVQAMRGTGHIAVSNYSEGGRYTFDADLQAASAAFRLHAAQLWQQHLTEDFGEDSTE